MKQYCHKCSQIKMFTSCGKWCKDCKQIYDKQYRKNNNELIKKRRKEKHIRHKQKDNLYSREYYLQNRKKILEYKKEWKKKNPEMVFAQAQKRKARKHWAPINDLTGKQCQQVKLLYKYYCLRCGKREPDIKLTIDHIVPLCQGGNNSVDNIQPLCSRCNSIKGGKRA